MLRGMKIRNTLAEHATYAWAAEQLSVSVQQVGRYVRDGVLSVSSPRCGKRETSRRLLDVDEVLRLKAARKVVGRG
jgi:predicted site-specific integrase-resolvase